MNDITLFDYWRSSSCYRVRIALWLKGLAFKVKPIDLSSGQQISKDHLSRQPQGLVPVLNIGGKNFTQSLAIIEYIDQQYPSLKLIPDEPVERHHVQSLSHSIAMEIHPLCNLRVVNHLADIVSTETQAAKIAWVQKFIFDGLRTYEIAMDSISTGIFCHGDSPTMADCCLIPQLYNARRWGVDYSKMNKICGIELSCLELPEFRNAHPDLYRST